MNSDINTISVLCDGSRRQSPPHLTVPEKMYSNHFGSGLHHIRFQECIQAQI
jgi:hypothetical protein